MNGQAGVDLFRRSLEDNAIEGSLPIEYRELDNAEQFLFSDNQLTGELPAPWADLTQLQILSLANNVGLVGGLPTSWSRMESLVRL
ncbi:hypothetical protein BSKO_09357 [Bryopsis sp. KO-2023]|nr:hypothetical protein BSKO_09357 [Bryopsis sp. KO-2023]